MSDKNDSMARIYETCFQLERKEQEVILALAQRLLFGQKTYGGLKDNMYRKNWVKEARDEAFDQLLYLQFEIEKED